MGVHFEIHLEPDPEPDRPAVLTTPEVAEILGLTSDAVSKLAVKEKLPILFRTPGGRFRFDRDTILRFRDGYPL